MAIDQLMKKDPVVCQAADSLNEAARIMWEHDCGFVPVVDAERKVVGVITDRDICMCAYTRGADLMVLRVSDAMSTLVRSCKPGDTLASAENTMEGAQVRRLPVVDDEARLIGILSLSDLARRSGRARKGDGAPSEAEIGHVLSAISQPRELAATSVA